MGRKGIDKGDFKMNQDRYLEVLLDLYKVYCAQMSSEYNFPDNPWTPERDTDIAALNAKAFLQSHGIKVLK
jgi:hypothetical protein